MAGCNYHSCPVLSSAATEMVVSVSMLEGQWGETSLLLSSLPADDTNSAPWAATAATAAFRPHTSSSSCFSVLQQRRRYVFSRMHLSINITNEDDEKWKYHY